VLVEAYFDESCTHGGSPTMALAGYLFRQDQSEEMAEVWRRFLETKGLPFFHMVDCAHGTKPFDKLSPQERVLVETRLIGLVKRHTIQGLGVTIDLEIFKNRFGEKSFMGTPYSLAFYFITRGVARWAENTKYKGEIAYFFESGHGSQTEAHELVSIGLRVPEIRAQMHYAGHAFVEKAKSPQVQTADLLAWQMTKHLKNKALGRPRRRDYDSLMGHPHYIAHLGDESFSRLQPLWDKQRQSLLKRLEQLDRLRDKRK